MGGICQGKPVEMTSMLSPQQQQFQNAILQQAQGQVGKGVPAYPGPMVSGVDPLQMMAANIMSTYASGQPYQAPPFYGAGGIGGIGGGGASGGGGTKPYRDWSRPRTTPMEPTGFGMDWPPSRFGSLPFDPNDPSRGVMPYGPQYPAGYDPMNDPQGWKRWFY